MVPDTCMLDISDNPVDSMWVDVPMHGAAQLST